MVVNAIMLASHLVITLIAVFSVAIRNEHRLTKIETDLSWLKENNKSGCEKESKDGEHCEVD